MIASIIKNPITDEIKKSINSSVDRLNFAVPFISSFSLRVLDFANTSNITDKRIVTRFDEGSISSFDLPTLKELLKLGFKIRYDNNIHLKLYIIDNDSYITSSNFTKGGFEDNIELTTKLNSESIEDCTNIFNDIWSTSLVLDQQLIKAYWNKYELLRKREEYKKGNKRKISVEQLQIGSLDMEKVINSVFEHPNNYRKNAPPIAFEANKIREKTKSSLLNKGFKREIFYVPKGHEKRRENLFYDFVYGNEMLLAGTGLRELQFKTVFEHNDFHKVIEYIYPEMLGVKPWNLNDKDELLEFCKGIFGFDIPQYKEAMPIRLASYFYPEYFLPIFKFKHLQKVFNSFNLSTDAGSQGEKLYAYNYFLAKRMKSLPYDNYIKSNISYQVMYIVELHDRLANRESYEDILKDYKLWQKEFIRNGMDVLKKLNIVK